MAGFMINKFILFLFIIIVLSGCQGNNSETATNIYTGSDTNVTVPTAPNLVIANTNVELTQNSQDVEVEITVLNPITNTPYSDGNVSIIYPSKVQDGIDVGSFENATVSIANGKAVFKYTGPKNLEYQISKSDTTSTFYFYYGLNYNKEHKITFTYNPDSDQVVLTSYSLVSATLDNNISMGLQSTKKITFYLKDSIAALVSDENILNIKLELLNESLADLKDIKGVVAKNITYVNQNSVGVNVVSKTISGVLPIKVTANFYDINNDLQTIVEVFNVVIQSGPPTAMSISYASTAHDEQDIQNAKFRERMVVAITDKYNNPVDSKPGMSVQLISGYSEDASGPLGYMYHKDRAQLEGNKFSFNQGIVTKVNIENYGYGYTVAPALSLSGGDGDFNATAVLSSTGSITNISIVNQGSGYTEVPTVEVTGKGFGFAGTVNLTSTGSFETITLSNPGRGYTTTPTISGVGGSGLKAEATLESSGSIKSFTINDGGTGYALGDELPIVGDGSGAILKVTGIGGAGEITNIGILSRGTGYTDAQVDTLTLGNKDAQIDLTLGYKIASIHLTDGGTGYTNGNLIFSGGSADQEAVASGVLSHGVSSVSIVSGGSGYQNPSVSILGNGQDAYASAVVKYPVSYVQINNRGSGYIDDTPLTITGGDGVGFSARAKVFSSFNDVNLYNEYLATFGDAYTYNASGKWDIKSISANYLTLEDQFDGSLTSNLGFAVGNNKRQDRCIAGKEWISTAKVLGDSTFDSSGIAGVEIDYDYYMVAKDIVMIVNLVGAQNDLNQTVKIGEATKHTLRGNGIEATNIALPIGLSYVTYRIYITLKDTAEPLRNANFTYDVELTGQGNVIHSVSDSMDLGIDECGVDGNGEKLQGRAYVDVTVSTSIEGTLSLGNLLLVREFN